MKLKRSLWGPWGVMAGIVFVSPVLAKSSAEGEWRSLFNGKNLDGWYTYLEPKPGSGRSERTDQDSRGIFKVEHGMLHILGIPETRERLPYGHLATREEFSDVHIHVEYKWGKKRFYGVYARFPEDLRDSGVVFLMTGSDADPRAAECQLEESNTGHMELWGTTATTRIMDPAYPAYESDAPEHSVGNTHDFTRIRKNGSFEDLNGWNSVDVLLDGNRVTQYVNGRVVNRAWNIRQPDPKNPSQMIPLLGGRIALVEEGAEVWFRNLKVRPLTPSERYGDWRASQ